MKIRISGKKELKNWVVKVGSSDCVHLERTRPFSKRKVYK